MNKRKNTDRSEDENKNRRVEDGEEQRESENQLEVYRKRREGKV
jgi:hypothetical protein